MTRIIELAHALGDEIAKSEEIRQLEAAKDAYEKDAELQSKLSEYETERKLLGEEFSKGTDEVDQKAVADLRARIEELTREICANDKYVAFANAQKAMNDLMAVGVLMTIPATVMGTILLFLMGTQLAAGFEMTHNTRSVTSFRHGLIIGIPIMFDVILSFAPAEAIAQIPALIRPIAGNGFVMGVIIVLILEHIILKDGQEVRPTKEQ